MRPTDTELLDALIELVTECGCVTCPHTDHDETGSWRCEIHDEAERPCKRGWREWLERRVREPQIDGT